MYIECIISGFYYECKPFIAAAHTQKNMQNSKKEEKFVFEKNHIQIFQCGIYVRIFFWKSLNFFLQKFSVVIVFSLVQIIGEFFFQFRWY